MSLSQLGYNIKSNVIITPDVLRTLVPSTRMELVTEDECQLYDKLKIDEQHAIWLIEQTGRVFISPVIVSDAPRRIIAGDLFANMFQVGTNGHFHNEIHVASRHERALAAEQTNESFILDDSRIIKWQLMLSDTKSREKEMLLLGNGFAFTPKSYGYLTYQEKLVASVYEFIQGASDGWTWCIQKAKDNDRGAWIHSLAEITSTMHRAFEGSGFAHGDLHVGQFLNSVNDFYVIDFEGSPIPTSHESAIADVASLMCSFIHVSAVIEKKYPVEHDNYEWLEKVLQTFQYEYEEHSMQLLDNDELWQLMLEHEEIEAEYAEKYLPHWKYVAEFGKEYIQGKING